MRVICSKQRGSLIRLERKTLSRLTEKAADLAGVGLGVGDTLCVHFLSSEEIARINKEFVGHEGLTDVICFDYRSGEGFIPDEDEVAAEILICPEAAIRHIARRGGLSFGSEVGLYLVHGLLHIAGEDDLKPAAKRRMRRRERIMLEVLGKEFDFDAIFIPLNFIGTAII